MTTKQERDAAAADKAWEKTVLDCAYDRVRLAIEQGGLVVMDLGGLAVRIDAPDGEPRHYYVRLTEVKE